MPDVKLHHRILGRAAQLALRYYLALRVSAAVATPAVFSLEQYEAPAPIVRTQPAMLLGRWDERELVASGADDFIITTRLDISARTHSPVISSN